MYVHRRFTYRVQRETFSSRSIQQTCTFYTYCTETYILYVRERCTHSVRAPEVHVFCTFTADTRTLYVHHRCTHSVHPPQIRMHCTYTSDKTPTQHRYSTRPSQTHVFSTCVQQTSRVRTRQIRTRRRDAYRVNSVSPFSCFFPEKHDGRWPIKYVSREFREVFFREFHIRPSTITRVIFHRYLCTALKKAVFACPPATSVSSCPCGEVKGYFISVIFVLILLPMFHEVSMHLQVSIQHFVMAFRCFQTHELYRIAVSVKHHSGVCTHTVTF